MTDVPMNLRDLAQAIALGDCRAAAQELDLLAREAGDNWMTEVALARSAAARIEGRPSIIPPLAQPDLAIA